MFKIFHGTANTHDLVMNMMDNALNMETMAPYRPPINPRKKSRNLFTDISFNIILYD